jgi:hypothetical protein
MVKPAHIQRIIDNIRSIVHNKCAERFTGTVTITISFFDGGIRSCKEQLGDIICIKSDTCLPRTK